MTERALHDMGVTELVQGLNKHDFSSVELTQHFLARAQADPSGSFLHLDADQALRQARRADERRAAGRAGPLEGVPIAHKDIFVTRDFKTTAGSKMLDGYWSPFDATVVRRLGVEGDQSDAESTGGAGMVCLGKLNCDEFAMGSGNENSAYGPVKNPWNHGRVPGGSSGGSAAAVAAGLVPAATGTDTGGSIRQPAGFCGITGIKPTYGRISRYGMIAYASSLDQAGPMARNAQDCALLLSSLCGPDLDRDSTSLDRPAEDFCASLETSLQGLRIGVPKQFFGSGLAPDVRLSLIHI